MTDHSPKPGDSVAARLVLLAALLASGLVVAGLGVWFTGTPYWWLAVPAAVAIGWLFVADPTACVAPQHPGGHPAADAASRQAGERPPPSSE